MPSPRVHRRPSATGARAPLLWSAALHAAAFLVLARFAPPRVTPAEVRFEVRVASVAYDAVEPPAPDDPRATEPVPADAPPPEAAPWTEPADETPLPDVEDRKSVV